MIWIIWLFEDPNFHFDIDCNIVLYHKKWHGPYRKKLQLYLWGSWNLQWNMNFGIHILLMNDLKHYLERGAGENEEHWRMFYPLRVVCQYANHITFQGVIFPFPPLFFLTFQNPRKLHFVKCEVKASFGLPPIPLWVMMLNLCHYSPTPSTAS